MIDNIFVLFLFQRLEKKLFLKNSSYDTGLKEWKNTSFCVLSNRDIVFIGQQTPSMSTASADPTQTINIYSAGQLKRSYVPPCLHNLLRLQQLAIGTKDYIAISCSDCQIIHLYDYSTFSVVSSYKMESPHAMCLGPKDTLFVVKRVAGSREVVGLDISTTQFSEKFSIKTNMQFIIYMCYLDFEYPDGTLVLTDWESNTICAININTHNIIWNIKGEIDGKLIYPHEVVATQTGEVIVADGNNARLIVLDGHTGELINTQDLDECDLVAGLHLLSDNTLIVWYGYKGKMMIAYYNIATLLP